MGLPPHIRQLIEHHQHDGGTSGVRRLLTK
jgi:hypothetical protein